VAGLKHRRREKHRLGVRESWIRRTTRHKTSPACSRYNFDFENVRSCTPPLYNTDNTGVTCNFAYPGYCLRWAYMRGSSRLMRIWSLSVKNT
jgi:hypothetical protein